MEKTNHYALRVLILALLIASGCAGNSDQLDGELQAWAGDPHHRVYPGSFGRDLKSREITLEGGRNELLICQLAVKSPSPLDGLHLEATDLEGSNSVIPKEALRIRYPQLIPVDEMAS